MNWRPKDWDNPYYKTEKAFGAEVSWNEYPEFETFEAGADAILEALEKEANGEKIWFDRTDNKDLLIYVEVRIPLERVK